MLFNEKLCLSCLREGLEKKQSKEVHYFVDLDGTICGYDPWFGFLHNTLGLFKTGLLFNPDEHLGRGRWSILTSRPKIDFPIVWFVVRCYYRLHPKWIVCQDSVLFREDEMHLHKGRYLRRRSSEMFPVYIDVNNETTSIVKAFDNLEGNCSYCTIALEKGV